MKLKPQLQNDLDTDYKAVVKAAELLDKGIFSSDQLAVLPLGDRKRSFSKDIAGSRSFYSEQRLQEQHIFEQFREGLYDMLPEGLFHAPPSGSAAMSEEEMVEDVQLRRAEEKQARRFFMPFEAALNQQRIMLEQYENRLDHKQEYKELTQIFASEWDEFSLLDQRQSLVWMHLLPLIHRKRNDLNFVAEAIGLLFEIPASARYVSSPLKKTPIDEGLRFRLGHGALGIDTIIGESYVDSDGIDELLLDLGPLPMTHLIALVPGTPNRQILDMLIDHLLPVDASIEIRLIPEASEASLPIGDENCPALMGFSTYL